MARHDFHIKPTLYYILAKVMMLSSSLPGPSRRLSLKSFTRLLILIPFTTSFINEYLNIHANCISSLSRMSRRLPFGQNSVNIPIRGGSTQAPSNRVRWSCVISLIWNIATQQSSRNFRSLKKNLTCFSSIWRFRVSSTFFLFVIFTVTNLP